MKPVHQRVYSPGSKKRRIHKVALLAPPIYSAVLGQVVAPNSDPWVADAVKIAKTVAFTSPPRFSAGFTVTLEQFIGEGLKTAVIQW